MPCHHLPCLVPFLPYSAADVVVVKFTKRRRDREGGGGSWGSFMYQIVTEMQTMTKAGNPAEYVKTAFFVQKYRV